MSGEPPSGPPPALRSNHEGQRGESNGEGNAVDMLGFVGKNQCSCGGVAVLPTSLGTRGGPGHIQSVFVLGLCGFGVAAPQAATGLGCIALHSVSKE